MFFTATTEWSWSCERTARLEALMVVIAPQRYPYSDVVVGLVQSHEPESYAATGRASHARQVKDDDPDKKG